MAHEQTEQDPSFWEMLGGSTISKYSHIWSVWTYQKPHISRKIGVSKCWRVHTLLLLRLPSDNVQNMKI